MRHFAILHRPGACLLAAALVAGLGGAALCADPPGFTGKVMLELLEDAQLDHKWKLLEELSFVDDRGTRWTAPGGGVLDDDLVPRQLRQVDGMPLQQEYRKASVVHAYFVHAKSAPWRDVHRMLYEASVAEGVAPPQAKLLYMTVYAGGWRWEVPGSSCYRGCHAAAAMLAWKPDVTEAELKAVIDWLRSASPSLEEIEQRVDAATRRPGPHLFAYGPRAE
jgi:hypothetical protein